MMDELYIGCTPADEECAQVGSSDYTERARKECRAYINQLIREFGEPPEGCRLAIKSNSHDFGTYYSVVCKYNDSEAAATYAFKCEGEGSGTWDDEARKELQ